MTSNFGKLRRLNAPVSPSDLNDVFAQVASDLRKRDELGWSQHGKPLDARDPHIDFLTEAYHEALDLVVYLKGELIRRGK